MLMTLPTISDEQRRRMIEEAAYFRAERRGFSGGATLHDWLEAEIEIDAQLREQAHETLLATLEERVAAVGEKLRSLRKKRNSAGTSAAAEPVRNAETLAQLRDALAARLSEIRAQGRDASQKAQQQAENIWDDISRLIENMKPSSTKRISRPKAGASSEDLRP